MWVASVTDNDIGHMNMPVVIANSRVAHYSVKHESKFCNPNIHNDESGATRRNKNWASDVCRCCGGIVLHRDVTVSEKQTLRGNLPPMLRSAGHSAERALCQSQSVDKAPSRMHSALCDWPLCDTDTGTLYIVPHFTSTSSRPRPQLNSSSSIWACYTLWLQSAHIMPVNTQS